MNAFRLQLKWSKTIALTGVLLFGVVQTWAVSAKRPNIVWIFSDDHSFQTIGAYGGRFQKYNPTPTIDKLAREGMRFERAYVGNSICAPSRATLLTGKHSHINGKMINNRNNPFNHDQPQFQKMLQKNGYQTVMIGKIHIDGKFQGFDYWEVLPGQGRYNNPTFITAKGKTHYKGYVTDIVTDRALNWLKNERDPNKPFMIMIHHKAAHRTWIPKAEDMDRYKDTVFPLPDNYYDDYATRGKGAHIQKMSIVKCMRMGYDLKIYPNKPAKGQFARRNEYYKEHKNMTKKELGEWKYQLYIRDYLRCIWRMDQNIARVLSELKKMGLDKNTIVMYSSDQGFYMGEHGWFDKRFMYEESFRTPLIAWWPGHIKPGSVNTDLVQNIDFAETFLDIAGAPIPSDMQGKSLVPLLAGKTPADWRKSLYYHYYEYPGGGHNVLRHEGVTTKRFKLIRFYGKGTPNQEEFELYDLKTDPHEMKNLYSNPEYAGQIAKLKKELKRLKDVYKVPSDEEVMKKFIKHRKRKK